MKKLIVSIALLVSLTSIGQTKKPVAQEKTKVDSVYVPLIPKTDTTKVIAIYLGHLDAVVYDSTAYVVTSSYATQAGQVVKILSEKVYVREDLKWQGDFLVKPNTYRELKEEELVTVKLKLKK